MLPDEHDYLESDGSPELRAELEKNLAEAQIIENARFLTRVENAKAFAVQFPEIVLSSRRNSLARLANLLFKDSEIPIEFGFMAGVTMFGIIAAEKLRAANDT